MAKVRVDTLCRLYLSDTVKKLSGEERNSCFIWMDFHSRNYKIDLVWINIRSNDQ